jgi:predicted Zn-dependent protease
VASQIGDVLVYRKPSARRAATSGVSPAIDTTRSEKRSDPFPSAHRGHDTHDAADRSLAKYAQQLADCGLLDDALSVLDTRLDRGPTSVELLALRGRIQLAGGHAEASERDLRAALAMLPDQPLVKFHHALALETLQQRGACCLELRQLLTTLETRNESDRLDESTSVKSLRQAAQELLRRME